MPISSPPRVSLALVASLMIAVPPTIRACIWDRDTLAMEQLRFPGVLAVVTGDFPRHSREYYEWRADTVGKQLAALSDADPQGPALRDDLAVALHKLGRHAEAVRVMEDSLRIVPDRYETLSNLGTFTIYLGDLPASRAWLQKALRINPDAHFGREKYQLWLVEHLMYRANPSSVPELGAELPDYTVKALRDDYATFVARRQNPDYPGLGVTEIAAAIQGVRGMMRFADHDNPVLREALGDLLKSSHPGQDAAHLARLAYVLAAQKAEGDDKARLAEKIARAMSDYDKKSLVQLDELARVANKSTAQGIRLAQKIRADEIVWIAADADVDREFATKYLESAAGANMAPATKD